jgi:hypothetical protein
MTDIDEIEKRVRPTIVTGEGRISVDDFEALLRAARPEPTIVCKDCDKTTVEYKLAYTGLCKDCATTRQKKSFETHILPFLTDDDDTVSGSAFPCAYPDCECDDQFGPCGAMREAGHTTFPEVTT